MDFPRDLGGDYSTERMSFEDYESLKILTKRTLSYTEIGLLIK